MALTREELAVAFDLLGNLRDKVREELYDAAMPTDNMTYTVGQLNKIDTIRTKIEIEYAWKLKEEDNGRRSSVLPLL